MVRNRPNRLKRKQTVMTDLSLDLRHWCWGDLLRSEGPFKDIPFFDRNGDVKLDIELMQCMKLVANPSDPVLNLDGRRRYTSIVAEVNTRYSLWPSPLY